MWIKKGDVYIADTKSGFNNQTFVLIINDKLKNPNEVTAVKIRLKETRKQNKANLITTKTSLLLDIENMSVDASDIFVLQCEDMLKYIGTVDYSTVNKVTKMIPGEIRSNHDYFPPKKQKVTV